MYSTLRAVFSYAEKSHAIPKGKSPCQDIDLPEVPEVEAARPDPGRRRSL